MRTGGIEIQMEDGLAVVRLAGRHGNAINADLVEALESTFHRLAADGDVRGVLLAGRGKLFCPGLDLLELWELDRESMARFMRAFAAVLRRMMTFPKPCVAALAGHALAGGCVLALTADWRVLGEDVLMGLNEVRVGVPLPYDVSLLLRDSVPPNRRTEVALLGRNFRGAEAVAVGLADACVPRDEVEPRALEQLREFADRAPAAFATTKSYLRSPTAARMASVRAHHVDEFLDCWFSDEARRRIGEVVVRLRKG